MLSTNIAQSAAFLADLRRRQAVSAALPADLRPADLSQAYQVQAAFRDLWPAPLAGWKIGATAAPVQRKFGVDEPFFGPFYAPDVHHSPATPEARSFPHLCLESEFAFRFAAALPAGDVPLPRPAILDAVDALVPAIELVGPRFNSLLFDAAPTAAADCALNAGFVFGSPVIDWRGYDLPAHPVTLTVDGATRATGTGANVLGDPITVLEWSVRNLHVRGIGLEAGQIISTGTTTGLVYLQPEQHAIADFGAIGRVEVIFTGPPHPDRVAGL